MTQEDLTDFLKKNLAICIWLDRDGCDATRVNVSLIVCDEEISTSTDYL